MEAGHRGIWTISDAWVHRQELLLKCTRDRELVCSNGDACDANGTFAHR